MVASAALPEITASADDEQELRALMDALQAHQAALVAPGGDRIPLPEPVYRVILQAVRLMQKGEGVMILPSTQELTTQRAANFLGVSRQYFVQLLEGGKIPFHKVGTHRRVSLKDVVSYRRERDTRRRKMLDTIAREAVADGIYDVVPPAE